MRNLFRHFCVFACTLFWNNGTGACNPVRFIRKYWAQLVLSSIAIQTIACTYGGEDVSYGDSSNECRPAFNVEKFTHKDYTECEKQIVEQVLLATEYEENFNKRDDATLDAWSAAVRKIDELAETCEMEHLQAEGSLNGFVCGDGNSKTSE